MTVGLASTAEDLKVNPRAFISSLAIEHSSIRETLFRNFGEAVWVAEHSAKWLGGKGDLEIVDTCTEFIEKAPHFICIFAGRRGTRLHLGDLLANATHFETELFHAALLGKQIHVFIATGFEPDPSLRGILEVLESSVDRKHWNQQLTDDQILSGIGGILNQNSTHGCQILRRLVGCLFEARRGEICKGTPLTEFFVGDSLADESMIPNMDLVDTVLTSLASEPNQRKKLSRIYIALREVMTRPFNDAGFLAYRNRLLAEWRKAASWYGLHAHVRSGVLAAAQSLALVREHLRAGPISDSQDEQLSYPGGELASALYSISKSLSRIQRTQALQEALTHLKRSLAEPDGNYDSLLAVRGSVFRQLGMFDEAVNDYEQVLKLRTRLGMEPSKIGEAMTELGFGYFRQRKIRKALDYTERGVELLREGGTSGFLLRGMRKLAVVSAANLHVRRALRVWREERNLARLTGMYDQL